MVKKIKILLLSLFLTFGATQTHAQGNRFAGFGHGALIGCNDGTYLTKAQRFIDSSTITDTVEIRAIKELVKGLMDSCLWSKVKIIYPFVGSSASSTKWNLKNPVNADTAYRILWSGGMSFGSYGVKGNGTNAYGNSFFKPSYFNTNSGCITAYVGGTNIDAVSVVMAAINSGTYTGWSIAPRISNLLYTAAGNGFTSVTNTDSRGIYTVTGTSSAVSKTFKNNSIVITTNGGTTTNNTNNIYISARNLSGSIDVYGINEIGFIAISDGLTDAESVAQYSIINKFITTLGR